MRSDEDLNSFTVDTQLQSKFATGAVDHTLLTGVDYLRMRNDIDADYGTADPISMTKPAYGNPNVDVYYLYQVLNRQEQTGLYAQDQAEWDKWVLTMGGRYDFAKTSALTRTSGTTAEINDQAFTWRGGINYLFDNGITPYFSYSESFEPISGTTQGGKPFDPARGKQYEAGVKANVDVTASYSYTDAEYTHDTWYEGRRPAEVPRNMASLWADYTFHETALSGLTVGAGTRYIGNTVSYYSAASPKAYQSFNVSGYALADATVKYDLARFGLPGSSVGVNVNNIFDREYVSSCYSEYACYWGAERQVVATATFRF